MSSLSIAQLKELYKQHSKKYKNGDDQPAEFDTIYRRNFYDHTLATHTMFKNGFKTLSRNDDVWCREIHAHIMNDLSFEPYELTEYYYRNFNYPVWRKIHDEIKLKKEYD